MRGGIKMNDIREIVTKAVIGKGKKKFTLESDLLPEFSPNSILGCWLINHKFMAKKCDNLVEVMGYYDVNVWYSHDQNTKTNVVVSTIEYKDTVQVNRIIRDCLYEGDEIIARTLQQPTCLDARIEDGAIVVEVEFELIVEIIGETKMRVSILGPVLEDDDDDESDYEHELELIDTNFLKNSPF